MLEVRVDLALDHDVIVSIDVDVFWIVGVSWVKNIKVSGVKNLVELFPCFCLGVHEGTSLSIDFWMVHSAVILKEFMRGNCLSNWRHNIHESLGILNITSLTNFEKVIEILVVSFINEPILDDLFLLESESSWINS